MKYAPANAEGLKPWVVTVSSWGRSRDVIVYAKDSGAAKYQMAGRQRYVYATARRATPGDLLPAPDEASEGTS